MSFTVFNYIFDLEMIIIELYILLTKYFKKRDRIFETGDETYTL